MPVIAIDFDGTIVDDLYPDIGEAIPGAIEGINLLYNHGYCIIINSCRAREKQDEMRSWLNAHNVKYCHINENCRERIVKYRTDCRKISADCHIDDKDLMALNFNNPGAWDNILNLVFLKFGDNHRRECE